MPPKAAASAGSDAFLITCIKCAKAKLEVDYKAVAKITGMSEGGVANKFRASMKQFEDEGATWTKSDTGEKATTNKAAPKRKATNKAAPKSEPKVDGNNSANEENPAAKKAKNRAAPKKNGAATAKDKKRATEASASSEETKDADECVESGEDEE